MKYAQIREEIPPTAYFSSMQRKAAIPFMTFEVRSSLTDGALLAAIGLYGTIAYTVAQRTNEIGIRMVLGADRQNIVAMVLREMLIIVAVGLMVGLPIAWFSSRALQSQLFGLSPHDAVSLAVAILTIIAVSAVAGLVPARRAARIEPMEALRYE